MAHTTNNSTNRPHSIGKPLDDILVAYHEIDRKGIIQRVSLAECSLLGLTPSAVLNKPVWELIQMPGCETPQSVRRKISEAEPPAPYEVSFTRRDGRRLNLEVYDAVLHDASGEVTGIRSVLVDITDRRRAEQAESEADCYRILFERHPGPMWVSDIETLAILAVNDAAVRKYGYLKSEFLRLTEEQIRSLNDTSPRPNEGSPSSVGGDGAVFGVHRKKDGSLIDVEITSLELPFQGRRARLVLAYEVTERRRLTDALKRSKEDAEKANSAKSEFLSRMSHELRTPLNAILGFAQLLDMTRLSGDNRESVAQILKAGQHLLGLINEVLDLTRIEAGRLAISPEPVSVSTAVQETLDLLAPLATRRKVSFAGSLMSGCRYLVVADQQRLKQVLLNLVSNGVKYNFEGGKVTIAYEEVPGNQLRVKVTDTGPGIPHQNLEKLFTPFERLGAEQTGVEGSGLGLALSKRLIEMMRGTIGVENNPEGGSTFWIQLPIAQDPVLQLEHVNVEPVQKPGPKQQRQVLYIEDNLSNITLIERIMEHRPHIKLLAAMQGRLGLDLAREHHPDLILLDLHLPDMSGEDVLRSLRKEPDLRWTPVIVISADATPGRMERLLKMGVPDYLTKPLDVQKFIRLLDTTLEEMA